MSRVDPFRQGSRFLTQQEELELVLALEGVEEWAPLLPAVARREVSPRPRVGTFRQRQRGPEAPVNVAAWDLDDHAFVVLSQWADYLVERGGPVWSGSTVGAARYLAVEVARVSCQDWAPEMKSEVCSIAAQMQQLVAPSDGSITRRYRLADVDVHHRAHQAKGDLRDMAAIHHAVTDEVLPESTLRSWVKRGQLAEEVGFDGAPRYSYVDVARLARLRRMRATRRKRA